MRIDRVTGERTTIFEGEITEAKVVKPDDAIVSRSDKLLLEMIRLIFKSVWYSETKLLFLVLTVLTDHHNNPEMRGTKEAIKSLRRAIDGIDKTLTKVRDVYIKKGKIKKE